LLASSITLIAISFNFYQRLYRDHRFFIIGLLVLAGYTDLGALQVILGNRVSGFKHDKLHEYP